jgi:hypothetical protein
MQVRWLRGAPARRSHGAEPFAGAHALALPHVDRRQVQVGGVEASVGRANRHRQTGGTGEPREPDPAGCRRHHRLADRRRDVDPAVLTGRVGIVAVPVEGDDLAADRPGPVARGRRKGREELRSGYDERGKDGGAELPHGARR